MAKVGEHFFSISKYSKTFVIFLYFKQKRNEVFLRGKKPPKCSIIKKRNVDITIVHMFIISIIYIIAIIHMLVDMIIISIVDIQAFILVIVLIVSPPKIIISFILIAAKKNSSLAVSYKYCLIQTQYESVLN